MGEPIISFVSPVYKAEKIVENLVDEINKVMFKIDIAYEIILVDDRSPDLSWEVMKRIAKNQVNVKTFRLTKNFGQHAAIMAGLSKVRGEWVVVLDCDLQDHPSEVEKLYNKAILGYDVVFARRVNRKDNFLKKCSEKFNLVHLEVNPSGGFSKEDQPKNIEVTLERK